MYSVSSLMFDHRTGEKMDTTDTASLAEEEFCILCKVGTQPASPAVLSSYLLVAFSFSRVSEYTITIYHKQHMLLVISTPVILLSYFCVYSISMYRLAWKTMTMCIVYFQAHIDTNVGEASALSATMFSQSLSNKNKTSLEGNDATGGQKECLSQGHRSIVQVDQASQCCGQGEGNCKSTSRTW